MNNHYFTDEPSAKAPISTLNVEILRTPYEVATQGGIFSPAGIDKGTAVFLNKICLAQIPQQATVVDLGCGWGPLTLALAATYPNANVIGVDVNKRARELAALNVQKAGFTNVTIAGAAEAAEIVAERGIDLLWSNPPIRIGKTALHELITQWLRLLTPSGNAWMVVQKNLGADSLAAWITAQGYPTEKFASSKGYRILHTRSN